MGESTATQIPDTDFSFLSKGVEYILPIPAEGQGSPAEYTETGGPKSPGRGTPRELGTPKHREKHCAGEVQLRNTTGEDNTRVSVGKSNRPSVRFSKQQ